LHWLEEWPHLRETLSEAEIAQAFRCFRLRAAIEYVLADDEKQAARYFSLAFCDGIWTDSDFALQGKYVSCAQGLNGQNVLGSGTGYVALARVLRNTSPTFMGRRLWHQIASNYHMQQVFRDHASGCDRELRPHLVKGIWHNPSWLLNRGVWSIGGDAFLGVRLVGQLRSLARRLRSR